MKKITVITKALTFFGLALLAGCIDPAAFPTLPDNYTYTNNESTINLHDLYSKTEADAFITPGQTNSVDISLKYGTPLTTLRDENGNHVWLYQVRTSNVNTQFDSGTNYKTSVFSGSAATSTQGSTAVTSRITTLKVVLSPEGIVQNYEATVALQ